MEDNKNSHVSAAEKEENNVNGDRENINDIEEHTYTNKKDFLKVPSLPSSPYNTNPQLLKPFDYGWKREIVYRNESPTKSSKTVADVYYKPPKMGKKLRSPKELGECSEFLNNPELFLYNFSFKQVPLGLNNPNFEIIRHAKLKEVHPSSSLMGKKTPAAMKPNKAASSAGNIKSVDGIHKNVEQNIDMVSPEETCSEDNPPTKFKDDIDNVGHQSYVTDTQLVPSPASFREKLSHLDEELFDELPNASSSVLKEKLPKHEKYNNLKIEINSPEQTKLCPTVKLEQIIPSEEILEIQELYVKLNNIESQFKTITEENSNLKTTLTKKETELQTAKEEILKLKKTINGFEDVVEKLGLRIEGLRITFDEVANKFEKAKLGYFGNEIE